MGQLITLPRPVVPLTPPPCARPVIVLADLRLLRCVLPFGHDGGHLGPAVAR